MGAAGGHWLVFCWRLTKLLQATGLIAAPARWPVRCPLFRALCFWLLLPWGRRVVIAPVSFSHPLSLAPPAPQSPQTESC
jgi:hypothetical protein